MSQKVEVLCPNGHRVPVRISPNTKVLQILEEACKKQGFEPPTDYELRHGRKTLDVTLSVRYAGIPNLATLEVVKASKARTESKVLIALQLLSGDRIQSEFEPGTTIWQILVHWENRPDCEYSGKLTQCSEEDTHPTCTYLREEIIGRYAMEHTTLKSLGLTGGKAMFRLQHRKVAKEVLQEITDKIDEEKAKHERIAVRAAKLQEEANTISKLHNKDTGLSSIKEQSVSNESENSTNNENTSVNKVGNVPSSYNHERNVLLHTESAQNEEPMEIVYTSGTRPKTNAGTSSQSRTEQNVPQAAMLFFPGPATSNDVQLTQEQELIAQSLAQAISPGMLAKRDTAERARLREERIQAHQNSQPVVQHKFSEFKFPESTKGQNLYNNELSNVDKEEYTPCDRETVIYRLDEEKDKDRSTEEMDTEEIPDEFFDLTKEDIQTLWADTQKQLKEFEDQPIMTKSMRLAAKEAKMSQYQKVIIRFVFPEKVAIQGLFRPRETVHSIHKFVKEFLEEKTQDFYLFTTPPRCILKDKSSTLIEADLAPMSVVHFGSNTKKDSYISLGAVKEISTETKAYEVLVNTMPKPSTSPGSTRSSAKSSSNAAKLASGKVPKWFKIGKR